MPEEKPTSNPTFSGVVFRSQEKTNRLILRQVEYFIWVLCSSAIMFFLLTKKMQYEISWSMIIEESYLLILLIFVLLFFPIIFLLVFGKLPLENLRSKVIGDITTQPSKSLKFASNRSFDSDDKEETAENLLINLCSNSKALAKSIFNRAGVYLLVGVMAAFSGLIFFYTQTLNYVRTPVDTSDITAMLIDLAPKFGILFFIELVAFYFLRLYKSALEDFRYYESIQRKREEILLLFKLSDANVSKLEFSELIKAGHFFSHGRNTKVQDEGMPDDIKLEKNEIALLTQIVKLINGSKS